MPEPSSAKCDQYEQTLMGQSDGTPNRDAHTVLKWHLLPSVYRTDLFRTHRSSETRYESQSKLCAA